MRILVIENERNQREVLENTLSKEPYAVDICDDGQDGFHQMLQNTHDLVVMNWSLHWSDGVNMVDHARKKGVITPVLMIIPARIKEKDKIAALDSGTDDLLIQPFSGNELLARIRALGRRPKTWAISTQVCYKGLVLNTAKRELCYKDRYVALTRRESALMQILLSNVDTVLPRDDLFNCIWGQSSNVEDANLDNYIRLVRRKLREISSPIVLVTIRYTGFCLQEERKNIAGR